MPPVDPPGVVGRVLMTADAVGGVWTYALDLSRALSRHGVRVSLAVMGPTPTAGQLEDMAGVDVELFCRPYRLEWMDDPWPDVAAAGEWLLELERMVCPDVVHLNGYSHATLAWRAPVVVVGHSCVLSWWRAVRGGEPPPAWSRYREAVARGLQSADTVVTPSSAMLAMLVQHYGPLRRTQVIPNGRHADGLIPDARSAKSPFVLAAGRAWDPAKNLDAVRAIAPRVSWPVCIAGEPRRPGGGEVSHAGVLDLGVLTPRSLAALMARAAIYVLPARYEPFGLSALEAGLARCALVLGDIRSLREVWGDAAIFVDPDDRCGLASAVQAVIDDERQRTQMSHRAQARARELTPSRMAQAYYDVYGALLAERATLVRS